MANSAYNSVEAIERWFKSVNYPYFTLYNGDCTEKKEPSRRIFSNISDSSVASAWEKLEAQILELVSNGNTTLTIFVKNKPDTNVSDGFTALLKMRNNGAGIAGINGALSASSVNPTGYVSKEELAKIIADEKEKWELRREIEDLRDAMEAPPPSKIEQFIGRITESVPSEFWAMGFAKILGIPLTQPINGVPRNEETQEETDDLVEAVFGNFERAGFNEEMVLNLSEWVAANQQMAHTIYNSQIANKNG